MRHHISIAVMAALLVRSSAAFAQSDWIYVSQEGHQYSASLNEDGAVMVSLYPVARFTGTGAMMQVITGTETLYLGRDCDAYSKVLGRGTWAWANGGFVIQFEDRAIRFPRQEIDANNGSNCKER